MNDTAIIITVICALLAGIVIACIWTLRDVPVVTFNKNDDLKHYVAGGPAWIGAVVIALGIIGVTSWTAQRDDLAAKAERKAEFERQLARLGCPLKREGDHDLLVLTIETTGDPHADKPYKATSCARYVERGYMRMQPKVAAAQ